MIEVRNSFHDVAVKDVKTTVTPKSQPAAPVTIASRRNGE
jgi:hypothetical protein